MTPSEHDPLERQIDDLLRSLPDCAAPAALEARVRQAIAVRSARPWWRRSYMEWPAAARVVFLMISAAAAGIWVLPVLGNAGSLSAAADSALRLPAPLAGLRDGLVATWKALFTASGAIPATWIYAVVAIVGAAYASLAGLGAMAYRMFYFDRQKQIL